jgi:hypothetical protein
MMLDYVPKWIQTPTMRQTSTNQDNPHGDLDEQPEESDLDIPGPHWKFLWENREEQRDRMTDNIAAAHSKWEQSRNPQWTKPKPGDLVLVRDIQKDKQHRKSSTQDGWDHGCSLNYTHQSLDTSKISTETERLRNTISTTSKSLPKV